MLIHDRRFLTSQGFFEQTNIISEYWLSIAVTVCQWGWAIPHMGASGKMHFLLHPFVTFATFAIFFVQFCTI